MKHFAAGLSIAAVLFLGAPPVHAQADVSGHWEGAVSTSQRDINITVDLKKNEKGEWTGSFGVPESQAAGLKVTAIQVEGKKVRFTVPEAPGGPVFECELGEDGRLAGKITVGAESMNVALKRTGEANVVVTPPSPAVGKQFEGNWEGTLEAGGGTLRIVLHLANQADGSVLATIDSPDQGASGLRVNQVVQKDNALEFRVLSVGASYKGALDKESGEIKGELTQRGQTITLNMKRAVAK